MKITKAQLSRIIPLASKSNIDKYYPHLVDTMQSFDINTPLRIAHFVAQIAHESGSLRYVREIASGEAYEGRKDLGNTQPGDGKRYKGRGLIQLTGRCHYSAFDAYTHGHYDVVNNPERLEEPDLACLVAGWFWHRFGCNKYADLDDVVRVTRIINGGRNGLQLRMDFLNRAKLVLGING